jgi:diadenosine tetraphosphate (Ap4A) HIT family hydrolase
MASVECVFCCKLAGLASLPAEEIVWQLPHSVVLLGTWQFYHGYCVVVARRHITELFHCGVEERQAYFEEMCLVAQAIAESFNPQKMNYELLGNQVPHLHWHLFPRYANDPQALKPVWLALGRAEQDEAERRRLQTGPLDRAATAERIRQKLQEHLSV